MMSKQFYSILCALVGLLSISVVAQATPQIKVPWQCSFEETEDLSDWILNQGTTAAQDQWVIGDATRSDGKQSLYISADGGEHTLVGTQANIVMAYRKIHFPEHGSGLKEYDISFDWKAIGNGTLYVYFDYYSTLITGNNNIIQYANSNASAGIPKSLQDQARYVYSTGFPRNQTMKEEQRWRSVSIDAGAGSTYTERLTANNSKRDFALVFVWVKKTIDPAKFEESMMGACIDNIQIASAKYAKPSDLSAVMQCEDSAFLITWTGNVNDYSVEYRRSTQSSWRRFTHQGISPNFQYRISQLREGNYDFRVRGWKGNDTTAYTVINNKSLLCLENHCINYVNFDKAECTYGVYKNGIDPYTYKGYIDYGPQEIASYHTVYSDPEEYDIRTNNKLKTIPNGEFASVRLGTWLCPSSNTFNIDASTSVKIGGYSITYDLTVDTATQALLLLKYAIVMEQAHDGNERAYFRLEVLDENGAVLDSDCGAKEFYCPADSMAAVEAGWNVFSSKQFPFKDKNQGLNGSSIYWKDWTAMGINLMQQGVKHGDHLKVRIIARGCTQGGHYCYGYFTLNCASATIETDQCSGNPKVQAEAPEGFSYTWFAEKNRGLLDKGIGLDENGERVVRSVDSELSVLAGDTNIYVCRLADLLEPSCYFELKTKLSPRTPHPMFRHRQAVTGCRNYVLIKDSARVADYGADGKLTVKDEACEFSDFTIRSLVTGKRYSNSNQSFTYEANQTGDTLEVTQTSYIADASCSKTTVDTIIVPDITSPDSVLTITSCRNVGYDFHGKHLIASGVYRQNMSNRFGCDSVEILNLTINPVSDSVVVDTISSLQLPYVLTGQYNGAPTTYQRGKEEDYATTQQYTIKFTNMYDCDSTVNLSLTVIPQLSAEVQELTPYCADDGSLAINYLLQHGDFDSLRISFSETAHQQNVRDTTIYHNPYAPIQEQSGQIVMPYTPSIVPNIYPVTVEFFQHPSCGNIIRNFNWDVRYSSSILQQMWSDAIFIRNAENNGGYTFSEYQWYKDGLPIQGETKPYLYAELDTQAEYYVQLTRTSDNVRQFTCAIVPTQYTGVDDVVVDIANMPTLFHIGQSINVNLLTDACISVYTMSGSVCTIIDGVRGINTVSVPQVPGYYILHIASDNISSITKTIIVVP